MAERKSYDEGHATLVDQHIERIEKSASAQIRRIEKATDVQLRKGGRQAEALAHKEKLEQLLEKTEDVADRLSDLIVFRKIRRMGSTGKRFFVLVVASAVILYWRGVWEMYDLFWEYVLPGRRITAAFISMLVGAIILVGTGKLMDALGPLELKVDEKVIINAAESSSVNPAVSTNADKKLDASK